MAKQHTPGWDPLAAWYDGWMGQDGSLHHRKLAIPAVLDLLQLKPGDHVLDIGAGQGVLAPYITERGACYTGVEISPRLIKLARQRHGQHGRFLRGDARRLDTVRGLSPAAFDSVVFLLSIQDMNPLDAVIAAAAWALREDGRLVMVMTHPCFRVPRQSGWGYDPQRKLQYRRVDGYLSELSVPMKAYGPSGANLSFHRPLGQYVTALAARELWIDALREVTPYQEGRSRAERRAHAEFPLFLGLRARKVR